MSSRNAQRTPAASQKVSAVFWSEFKERKKKKALLAIQTYTMPFFKCLIFYSYYTGFI